METQEQVALTPEAQQAWKDAVPKVEILWGEIFKTANTILQGHLRFGFAQIADKLNPSVDDTLLGLQVVESLLDTINASGALEYSEQRMVANAKQQIWLIQNVADALKADSKEDYDGAIDKMSKQAIF